MEFFWVFIGGGLGSMTRYSISRYMGIPAGNFPWATFMANIASCILMGLAIKYLPERENFQLAYKLLILVGFCGGFSTFSTFSLETLHLIQKGQFGIAFLYVLISIISCMLLLFLISKI